MSAQTIGEAFAPIEAKYKHEIMYNTWGHLAPKRNKKYHGQIIFAVGCMGSDPLNPIALHCEFNGLDESPWFFDAMSDFLSNQDCEAGNVYKFTGCFQNYTFTGIVERVFKSSSLLAA